ncbi:hypothetical protein CR492_06360 [Methylocella silvestris]|uniref:Uncharacterized protein n=2 Tax=Methylocella silvestris TaxID=199596 RepID=A0A2J7TJI1_METSI|nr:hypothetical protein CR492_06360 [Methylocella silvestris]
MVGRHSGKAAAMDQHPFKNPASPVVNHRADQRHLLPEAPVRYLLLGGLALVALSGLMMFVVQ